MAEHTAQREIGPALRAVGGLLLGLAIVGVILGRQRAGQEPTVGRAGGQSDTTSLPMPAAGVSILTIYVTGTQEHADQVTAQMDEANAQRIAMGASPLHYRVTVVDAGIADAAFSVGTPDDPALNGGGPTTQIVDLRTKP